MPGAVHDITAARTHGIFDALEEAAVECWPTRATEAPAAPYECVLGPLGDAPAGQQAVYRSHAKIRALVERAMATLKTWRLLRKLRCSTTRITSLVQAVLTLHLTCSK
ncbi:transposase family protein [Streptomyces sp. NPDC019396]|uniref:transposase family protein n=1 Tax=Streptomyces sp. NPDC019396 TaxID=3154687 RepID=UPI0033DDA7FC